MTLVAAEAASAVAVPADCRSRIQDAASDAPIDLDRACPGLRPWLRRHGYAQALEPSPETVETAGAARALLDLLPRSGAPGEAAPLDRAVLERIVGDVRRPDAEPASEEGWWSWLREWLAQQFPEADWSPGPWLKDLLEPLGSLGRVLVWLGYLLLLAAVAALAWGLVRWLRRHPGMLQPSRPRADASGTGPVTLESIRARPAGEQPAAMLRHVVGVLRGRGELPAAPGRTDAELAAALARTRADAAPRFRRLATCAGTALYGDRAPSATEIEGCLDDARVLIGEGAA